MLVQDGSSICGWMGWTNTAGKGGGEIDLCWAPERKLEDQWGKQEKKVKEISGHCCFQTYC